MRKLIALLAASALISFAFTSISYAETKTVVTEKTTTVQTTDANTPEDKNDSPSVGESAKVYWNKFIDLFTGPATNK